MTTNHHHDNLLLRFSLLFSILCVGTHCFSSLIPASSSFAIVRDDVVHGNHHGSSRIGRSKDLWIMRRKSTSLNAGSGIAEDYIWREAEDEIEVTVKVPPGTKTRDIQFQSSGQGVDLRLRNTESEDEEWSVLLDGKRKLRGRINMDGTFWSISDSSSEEAFGKNKKLRDLIWKEREVTVHIEKFKEPLGELEVEQDWGGVYPKDEDEVLSRNYHIPEELDVREYSKSLGVDVDNINMSMVDKSMFSIVNMTKDTMDNLQKTGFAKEVAVQDDGSEFVKDKKGVFQPFSSPFADVDVSDSARDSGSNSNVADTTMHPQSKQDQELDDDPSTNAETDSIDSLTVNQLKDHLRGLNLKVTGNKQELRDRLRNHVQSLLSSLDDEFADAE